MRFRSFTAGSPACRVDFVDTLIAQRLNAVIPHRWSQVNFHRLGRKRNSELTLANPASSSYLLVLAVRSHPITFR